MSIELEHQCDEKGCRSEADECYCTTHMDAKLNEAFDEGFAEGKKEGLKEANNE